MNFFEHKMPLWPHWFKIRVRNHELTEVCATGANCATRAKTNQQMWKKCAKKHQSAKQERKREKFLRYDNPIMFAWKGRVLDTKVITLESN